MRFEAIEAIGVGPLREQELMLAPGLNVVHGVNESGKSSWHAALIAGWLGLRRGPGRHRAEDRKLLERFTPWDGSPFVAAVRVVTDDGERYRFRHNLSDLADHEVLDGANAVVTGELEHDGTADGAHLLGLTRDIARATLCVSQADVLAVTEAADGLQAQLQSAAASANRDGGTAATALARLEEFRRDHVGLDRANSTRPLRRAKDELRSSQTALRDAEVEHSAYLDLVARRDQARDHHRGLRQQRDELQRAILAGQLRAQQAELDELRRLQRQVADGQQLPPVAGEEERREVDRLRQRLADRPERAAVSDEVDRLEQELAALPAVPDGDTAVDAVVADAHEQLRVWRERRAYHHRQRPTPAVSPEIGGLTPDELDRHAAVLQTPVPDAAVADAADATADTSSPTPVVGSTLLAGAVLVGLIGVAALVADQIVGGLLALVAAVAAALAGYRITSRDRPMVDDQRDLLLRAARQAEREQLLVQREQSRQALTRAAVDVDDPAALRALADQARHADRDADLMARWDAEDEQARTGVATATNRLADALAERQIEVGDDVDAAYEGYRLACSQRAQQAAEARRRGDLDGRLTAARELARRAREHNHDRAEAERQLLERARALGFDGEDPDAADQHLARWHQQQRQLDEQHEAAERVRAELEVRLDGATLEGVATEVAALAADVDEVTAVDDLDQARRRLADHDEQLGQARDEAARLDGEVASAASGMAPVAEARERVERAEDELARVEGLRHVLDVTTGFLEDASRRVNQDIAPTLREAVVAHLPAITRHRYDDARVDPRQLQVTVRTDTGAYRPAEHLSHGTSEQVYLLLRLGLAEHLVITDEAAPLLLDDVTVQFDEHRTRAFLDLCLKLAQERQIVLFTQERTVLEWAETHLPDPATQLHRLPDPATGAGALHGSAASSRGGSVSSSRA